MINKAGILALSIFYSAKLLTFEPRQKKTAIIIIIEIHYRKEDIKLFLLVKT